MALFTRREFLAAAGGAALTARFNPSIPAERPVVSIVKIRNGNVDAAVEEAIDLLGGMSSVAKGKDRIMLKPNLVAPAAGMTTKPPVIRALVRLMQKAHKEVCIGEASAAAEGFNAKGAEVFRTRNKELLNGLQQKVFDDLGYTELAKSLRVPLVNLHTGELVDVKVPGGFVFDKVTIHRSLTEIDLLCSVPMMKTHSLAGVTLGMKNLIGLYPGTVYQAVRGHMHDLASKVEPSGTAVAVIDMVRANKLGLVVVDASTAMEGNGPANGPLVPMETIIAGTNPLATDMVAANVMGFEPAEIPKFSWANKAGLRPERLDEIEIRGVALDQARRKFARPIIVPWTVVQKMWGSREI